MLRLWKFEIQTVSYKYQEPDLYRAQAKLFSLFP